MSFYQRASKLATAPAGAAMAASSTSLLLGVFGGRQYATAASATANKQMSAVVANRTSTLAAKYPSRALVGHPRRKFASSPTASVGSSEGRGFVAWYEGHLAARPVATKAVTGAILWGAGDAVAQLVPHYFPSDGCDDEGDAGKKKGGEFRYDFPRTGRAVFFGFALHAPLSHAHFNFLEWMTVRGGFKGLSIPVFKTVMEQFVYWSWISNSLYHGAMGAMQGMNPTQIYDRISDVLWDTQVAQWTFWIPVQLLNFQFVPVRHQLNVVLLTSIAWTALLSAWYPPEEEEEKAEKDGKQ